MPAPPQLSLDAIPQPAYRGSDGRIPTSRGRAIGDRPGTAMVPAGPDPKEVS